MIAVIGCGWRTRCWSPAAPGAVRWQHDRPSCAGSNPVRPFMENPTPAPHEDSPPCPECSAPCLTTIGELVQPGHLRCACCGVDTLALPGEVAQALAADRAWLELEEPRFMSAPPMEWGQLCSRRQPTTYRGIAVDRVMRGWVLGVPYKSRAGEWVWPMSRPFVFERSLEEHHESMADAHWDEREERGYL